MMGSIIAGIICEEEEYLWSISIESNYYLQIAWNLVNLQVS